MTGGSFVLAVVSQYAAGYTDDVARSTHLNRNYVNDELNYADAPKTIAVELSNLLALDFFVGHFCTLVFLPSVAVGLLGYSIERHKAARKDATNAG